MKKNITLILSLFAAVGTLFACTPAPVQEQEQEDDPTENTGEDDPTGEDNPDQKPGEDGGLGAAEIVADDLREVRAVVAE